MPFHLLKLFLVISILKSSYLSHAADITSAWFADGHFLEENESQRMTNGFGGRLDFTDDADLFNNWRMHWNSVSSLQYPQPVYIVVFVTARPGAEGEDSDFDITIRRPDGTVCNSFTNRVAIKIPTPPAGAAADVQPTLQLGTRVTGFQLDPPDPAGTYTVEVELRDRIRHVSVKLKKLLLVNK